MFSIIDKLNINIDLLRFFVMRRRIIYIILAILILVLGIIYANDIAKLIIYRKTVLKPTPTTPDSEVVRLEYGDVVEIRISRLDNKSPLLFAIRAYNIRINPGSEFNPALVRYIPIVSLRELESHFNTTIEVKRTAYYAVEVFNEGNEVSEVEVEVIPIVLEAWTTRIRFILAAPLVLLLLYLIALYIER